MIMSMIMLCCSANIKSSADTCNHSDLYLFIVFGPMNVLAPVIFTWAYPKVGDGQSG